MQSDSETDYDSQTPVVVGDDLPPPFYGNEVVASLDGCSEVSIIEQALREVNLIYSLDLGTALEVG